MRLVDFLLSLDKNNFYLALEYFGNLVSLLGSFGGSFVVFLCDLRILFDF